MQSAKETASNIEASAKAGMEKTKATLQEKGEKMTTRDPLQKEMATQRKEERIDEAELRKQEAKEHNAAVKQSSTAGSHTGQFTTAGTGTTGTYSTTGEPGGRTGHQMSALPGHGTGQPMGGHVTEGVVGAHPTVGTGRTSGHDPRVGPNAPGYGTGGSYT